MTPYRNLAERFAAVHAELEALHESGVLGAAFTHHWLDLDQCYKHQHNLNEVMDDRSIYPPFEATERLIHHLWPVEEPQLKKALLSELVFAVSLLASRLMAKTSASIVNQIVTEDITARNARYLSAITAQQHSVGRSAGTPYDARARAAVWDDNY